MSCLLPIVATTCSNSNIIPTMKSIALRFLALSCLGALVSFHPALADTVQPCGNQSPYGPSQPPPCGQQAGVNLFSAYTGNAHRDVLDLSVFGSVGRMPLQFVRSSNTRLAPQSASQGRFGRDGVWTHNYQWLLRYGGIYSNGQPALRIGYPDGSDTIFVLSTSTAGLWLPPANTDERLFQDGTLFTLQRSTGEL